MFNLLPENLKSKIKEDYNLRRWVTVLVFIIFIEVSFLVLLFPSWIVSVYRDKDLSLQDDSMNQLTFNSNINKVVSDVTDINTKLNTLNTALEYPKIIPFVNTILAKRTKSIYINQLVYSSQSGTEASIVLDGVSLTRESLVAFVKSLEETQSFKVVNLPISNIAKEKDINFSINLTIAP